MDITSNRHRGSLTSVAAFEQTPASWRSQQREQVYAIAKSRGLYGITTDEVAHVMGTTPNAVSGRLTELKAAGRLLVAGAHRKTTSGCMAAVLIADIFEGTS